MPFETGKYEYHNVSSFIYEPIFNADGSLKDFRILYASDIFARGWVAIYHNEDYLGALLKESTLMDDYSLEMMERFITHKPHAFMTYMPMVNLHLYFEPIPGLPAPYAGFYLTNITGQAYRDARDHFLRNIRQMKNNAVLIQRQADGHLDPIFVSAEYARMMECSEAEAKARLSGIGIFKTTVADDRPLVRSMLERRVAFDGSSRLTMQKLTAKHNKVWVNVQYAFIDDFDEHYIYCTYTDVTTLKAHEERLRSTYSSLGNNFYQASEMTLANLRVNLTRNVFEEIKGADTYDTDDMNNAYSDAVRLRAVHYPIESERAQFLKLLDRENLMQNYEAGNPNASLMLYSVRGDGRSCFVNISASVTRHPLTGDIVAFITERKCNSEKVKDTLTNKILAQQFDMVAYLVDGSYDVTIGDSAQVHRGGIFPTFRKGDYRAWVERQVLPTLPDDDARARLREALSLDTVERQLQQKEPYVVDMAIEAEGETYYKQFDFYSVNPQARFYILLKSDTTEIQKQHMEMNERQRQALEAAKQANVAKTAFLSNIPNGAMDWNDYLHPEDRKRYMDVMMPLLSGGAQTYDLTYRVRTVKGEYVNFRAVGAVLRGSDGKPSLIGGAMINQGLTENTDPVTVLPNKNACQEQLAQLLEAGRSVVSLQIGIDRFSQINEVHGYTYGNRTLQEVAWRIQEVVKDRGTVYRTEGATFVVLSDTLTRDEVAAIYDHIRYQLQRGIRVNGIKNILTAGGGMISSVGTEVSASTVYACMNYAYEESRRHKHGDLVDFNGSVNYDGTEALELINTIRECAAEGCRGFELEYLPVIDAQTGRINGAEAIIYWLDARHGRVASEAFMPILERDFIFEELGNFMLERGLSDGVRLLECDPDFLLCLDVYRIQLESGYFIDALIGKYDQGGAES